MLAKNPLCYLTGVGLSLLTLSPGAGYPKYLRDPVNFVSVLQSFQLPTTFAPRQKPRWISMSRVKPRHSTMLPGGRSRVRER